MKFSSRIQLGLMMAAAIGAFGASQVNAAIVFNNTIPPPPGVVPQQGSAFSLQSLLPHDGVIPGIIVADKLFYNFGYVTGGSSMPAASNVTVERQITNDPTWGLRFSGAFGDTGAPGASDALIKYEVLVLDPSFQITDAHIAGNPLVIGSGQMTVTETWTPDVGASLIKIFDLEPGHFLDLVDSVVFPNPQTHLFVQKDIQAHVNDGDAGSVAIMSFVDQTYSQGPGGGGGGTPEPASIGVLAIGAMGLIARRRK